MRQFDDKLYGLTSQNSSISNINHYSNKTIVLYLLTFSSQSSRPSSERSDRPPILTLADLSPSISDHNNELSNERLNSSYHLPSIQPVRSSSSLSDSNRRSQHSNHSGREVVVTLLHENDAYLTVLSRAPAVMIIPYCSNMLLLRET
jgi:hypothetical protein